MNSRSKTALSSISDLKFFDPGQYRQLVEASFQPTPRGARLSERIRNRVARELYQLFALHTQRRAEREIRRSLPEVAAAQDRARMDSGIAGSYQFVRLYEIWQWLECLRPSNALEMGSGGSTSVFATYFKDPTRFTSVEENAHWLERTKLALGQGQTLARFLFAPRIVSREDREMTCFYDISHDEAYEFMYVDGPTNIIPGGELGLDGTAHMPNVDVELFWKNGIFPGCILVDGRRATVRRLIQNGNGRYKILLRSDYIPALNPLASFNYRYHTVFLRDDLARSLPSLAKPPRG